MSPSRVRDPPQNEIQLETPILLAASNLQIMFFRWYSLKMEWAKVLPLTTCLKASTFLPYPCTRAAQWVKSLFRILCFPPKNKTKARHDPPFQVSVNFGPHFKHPPKDLKYQPVSVTSVATGTSQTTYWLLIYLFDFVTLFHYLLDEWHGLGSRDRTHAGWHAVPRGDGRGWPTQPSMGRMNPHTLKIVRLKHHVLQ